MPGDCFSLTVRVSCKIYLICFFCLFAKFCKQFSLSPDRNIFRFKIILYVNAKLTLGKIPHMSVGCLYFISCSQEISLIVFTFAGDSTITRFLAILPLLISFCLPVRLTKLLLNLRAKKHLFKSDIILSPSFLHKPHQNKLSQDPGCFSRAKSCFSDNMIQIFWS